MVGIMVYIPSFLASPGWVSLGVYLSFLASLGGYPRVYISLYASLVYAGYVHHPCTPSLHTLCTPSRPPALVPDTRHAGSVTGLPR